MSNIRRDAARARAGQFSDADMEALAVAVAAAQTKQNRRRHGGITLLGALFLILFTTKILGLITASWWAVTAPLWAPIALIIVLTLLGEGILAADRASRRRTARKPRTARAAT